jgi:hypothetical protein
VPRQRQRPLVQEPHRPRHRPPSPV